MQLARWYYSILLLVLANIASNEASSCYSGFFSCADGSRCIPIERFCNGYAECGDGSDEVRRNNSVNYDPDVTFCRKEFGNYVCVLPNELAEYKHYLCHEELSCDSDQFPCVDGSGCVNNSPFCSGSELCVDGSDSLLFQNNDDIVDVLCGRPSCDNGTYSCAHNSVSICAERFCDGFPDCWDGSDEPPLRSNSVSYDPNVTFCRGKSGNYICVLPNELVEYKDNLCHKELSCDSEQFPCADGSGCVLNHKFCDGSWACRDGSDEPPLRSNSAIYDANVTFCRGITGSNVCVLPNELVEHNGNLCHKEVSCEHGEFPCADGIGCVSILHFCDGHISCQDASDEPPLRSMYDPNVTFCRGKSGYHVCVLPNELVEYKDDLCHEAPQCLGNSFVCADGLQCVTTYKFCDGFPDCWDGSDEPPLRNNRISYHPNVTFCRGRGGGKICVLPKEFVAYKDEICHEELSCDSDQFPCADGSGCLQNGWFCDGSISCQDGSDEPPLRNNRISYHPNVTFCRGRGGGKICVLPKEFVAYKDEICHEELSCDSDQFPCADGSGCLQNGWFCDGSISCQDKSDEPPLRNNSLIYDSNVTYCRGKSGSKICVLSTELAEYKDDLCNQELSCDIDQFPCADGSGCVVDYQFCSGLEECQDGSDSLAHQNNDNIVEVLCHPKLCADNTYKCADESLCISTDFFCDGYQHCRDGSDEPPLRNNSAIYDPDVIFCRGKYGLTICVLPNELAAIATRLCHEELSCDSDQFPCADGSGCFQNGWFCDGSISCQDRTDEPPLRNNSAIYDPNVTFCRGKSGSRICVLPNELVEHKDNLCHEELSCDSDQFPCADGSGCFSNGKFCDGYSSCQDGSDEPPLRNNSAIYDPNVTFCRGKSGRKICVLPNELVEHKDNLCHEELSCDSDQFPCADGSGCRPNHWFCDGSRSCQDGSDEPPLRNNSANYDPNVTFCRVKFGRKICVLPNELVEHKDNLCHEELSCDSDQFPCADGSGCSPNFWFCNQYLSCEDKSDSLAHSNSDSIVQELCGIDPGCNTESEFECSDGSLCIDILEFGDYYEDCDDGSDEPPQRQPNRVYDENSTFCRRRYHTWDVNQYWDKIFVLPDELVSKKDGLCEGECPNTEFSCRDQIQCLDPTQFCDGLPYCDDGSDEVRTPTESPNVGRMCIRKGDYAGDQCMIWHQQICDGAGFCKDDVDECLCGENNKDGSAQSETPHPYLKCISPVNGNLLTIGVEMVCDNKTDCIHGKDEKSCPRETATEQANKLNALNYENLNAEFCNGIPETEYFVNEECSCKTNAEFCQYILTLTWDSDYYDGYLCKHPQTSSPTINVHLKDMCNGFSICADFADERGCASRFYCTDEPMPNILMEQRCDRQDNCENAADEKNCSHFLCNDGGNLKYLPQYAVCDGIQDCDEGSDECQPGCIDSVFSDETSLITNKAVLALVWIISTGAIIGNFLVMGMTIYGHIKPHKAGPGNKISVHTKLMKRVMLSLSISDLLVGVYTLSICITSVQFDRDYCLVDREWRSSSTCSGLGALLVVGSQQSVFTMVIIALQRLHAITRPFSQPKLRQATAVIFLSWIISVVLGTVPLFPQMENYFVSSIMFTDNEIFKTMYHNETQHMINWLNLMHPHYEINAIYGVTEWSKVKELITEFNPNISVVYEFGYYSSHTACLPTFFPDQSLDKAWGYSLVLLIINFIAFTFMLVSYIVLYRYASRNKAVKESNSLQEERRKQNIKMQRKLTRIVASDFLCWMPICIMGFLQLAGVDIPKDAYLPAGLLIVPINSALNPLLYSDIPDLLFGKIMIARQWLCSTKAEPQQVGQAAATQRQQA